VTEEQYHDFYKHIAHDFEAPLAYTHHKVEGGHIDYTCLLFIPQHAPFDLWQRDSHNGLKLYVQRVFIMDKVEQFLPHYLRFMKGVLDTTALPLNISREILQDHPVIPKLRSALVRHSLDMLERIANDDQAKYTLFWSEFGNVLKEGPAEDFANRERIAKLFRFSSTHTEDNQQSVSLMDYVGRMKPTQQKIYFITADHLQAARFSPHLEIFRKNNIEVLLLTDKIDEWVVSHLPEFDGKPLQSVAKGDLSADELSADANAQENEEQKHEQQQAYEALLTQMKSVLGNKIKEVRLSERLTTSPSCLVRDQSAIGPQMERLLKAAGQPVDEVKPILELNPDHIIIQKLKMSADQDKLADWTYLLYDQALLAEGGNIADPAAFVQRMNKLWLQSL
jgi:molecular chaperone HtpG